MQPIIATNDAKLKGNRLQEEGKQQRSRSLELGGLEIRGSTTVVRKQSIRQSLAAKGPHSPQPYPAVPTPWHNGRVAKPIGPCSGTLDKRGRTSGSSRGQVVVEGPLLCFTEPLFNLTPKLCLGTAQVDPFVRLFRLRVMKICMLSIDCMMDGLDVECPLGCMSISITGPLSLILLE